MEVGSGEIGYTQGRDPVVLVACIISAMRNAYIGIINSTSYSC